MDQSKELEQEVLNILSTPVIEKFQLSDSNSTPLDLGNEETKNSTVSVTWVGGSAAELQSQNMQISRCSPQLENENVEVSKAASMPAETVSKNLMEDLKVDSEMLDTHLLYKRNSTETDKESEMSGSSYTLENVAFIDLTVDSGDEQHDKFQKTSSALVSRKASGKSRHVPYSASLSSHTHLRTISGVNKTSTDHVSVHVDSHADVIKKEKFDATSVAEILASASDKLNRVKDAEMDLERSACTMRICNPKDLEIKSQSLDKDTCQSNEPMNMSLQTEVLVDIDCPVVNDDLMPDSFLIETSFCFGNMSLHASDEDASQILSPGTVAEVATVPLPGECEPSCSMGADFFRTVQQPSGNALNAAGSVLLKDASATILSKNTQSTFSIANETVATADVASIPLPGECEPSCSVRANSLRTGQQLSGSALTAADSVLSKNGSDTNLSKNTQPTCSVAINAVANMQQNGSALQVNVSKGIQQQKTKDVSTIAPNNVEHKTYSSADILKSIPLGISNDSRKNIQNSITTSSSKNVQHVSISANASKDLQKENCIDVAPSHVQSRINATYASENKEQKAALKKVEQSGNKAVNLSANAQQSSKTVDPSKNKEQKVGDATTAAKNVQQRNSRSLTSENVQPNCNSATSNKIQETTGSAGKSLKTTQQQNGGAVSTSGVQRKSDSTAFSDNVQPPKRIASDFPKESQKENTRVKLDQTLQNQSAPVFKHPNVASVVRLATQEENINPRPQVPSSQDKKSLPKTETKKRAQSLLSTSNIQYQPLHECQDLLELASCKTTDYRVQHGKPKHILEESSRANTFERFKHFQFTRATANDVLELYGRLPVSLPEDLEEVPICKEDIADFTSKKNKVQDLEKVLHGLRH